MNYLILKHGHAVTFGILAVLAWVVYRRISLGWSEVVLLAEAAGIVWVLGTLVFIYYWPRITLSAYKRAAVKHGLGGGPIPINTLYAASSTASPSASRESLLATGAADVLYVGGVLDLAKGPLVLHVPDFSGRYYSVQFTDPTDGADFAYVGKRVTGTEAGDYLIVGPGWKGAVPQGMKQISSPNNSVLVVGRVFVESSSDISTAFGLAKQIQLTPMETNVALLSHAEER